MSTKAPGPGAAFVAELVAEVVKDHGGEHSAESIQREVLAALTRAGAEGAHEDCTDLGNARRLVRRYRSELRYCEPLGGWMYWDGRRWARDETGEAERRAKATARQIFAEAASAEQDTDRTRLAKWALSSQSVQKIRAMLSLAQTEREVVARPSDFDADPWLLNVQNGTLNLKTGKLRPHHPADLITKLAPVVYLPDASAPRWEAFLREIMDGDPERVDFLRRFLAYAMTGDVREQVVVVFHGLGANGKTTLLEVVRHVLGDYAMHADPSAFLTHHGEGPRSDIARLKGARLVTASETTEGRRLDAALVKQLSGGDTVTARHLYQDYFEFKPTFKVVLSTNHKPRVAGDDDAIWRRLRLVPFDVTFPPERQDKTLVAKLQAEASGILRWMVEGCLAWQRDGLAVPDAVRHATTEYRQEQDALGLFLEERCDTADPAETIGASELYVAYRLWCEGNGEHVHSQRRFGQLLTERGFERFRVGSGMRYRGVNLVNLSEWDSNNSPREEETRESYRNQVHHRSHHAQTLGAA